MSEYAEIPTKTLAAFADVGLAKLDFDDASETKMFTPEQRELMIGEVAAIGFELWERGKYV